MKCQRQILRIRWQDHIRNGEVTARIGLRPVMESIRRRREAIFGHVARMSPNIPAHQALRLQVEASVGRRPDHDWVRSSGRPRNRWIDQLRQDHQRSPADYGEQPSGVVILERRYGPRRLRDDDDDNSTGQGIRHGTCDIWFLKWGVHNIARPLFIAELELKFIRVTQTGDYVLSSQYSTVVLTVVRVMIAKYRK